MPGRQRHEKYFVSTIDIRGQWREDKAEDWNGMMEEWATGAGEGRLRSGRSAGSRASRPERESGRPVAPPSNAATAVQFSKSSSAHAGLKPRPGSQTQVGPPLDIFRYSAILVKATTRGDNQE